MELKNKNIFVDYVDTSLDLNFNWSKEMTSFIEESSKNHFIDIYNRKLVSDCLKDEFENLGCRFIDLGCSSGYLLEELREKFPGVRIEGGDYEISSLLLAHQRNPSATLSRIDITKLPFESESFNNLSCLNVLEHIEEDQQALSEIYRILKPGGRALITVPAGENLMDLYDEVHYHVRRYSKKTLMRKLRTTSFEIEKINYFASFLYPIFYVIKKLNQVRYKDLTFQQKKELAMKMSKTHDQSKIMNMVCLFERMLALRIPLPFGIRLFVLLKK